MTITIERVQISSLHKDDKNARKHSTKNLDAIKSSLEEFGQQKPIVVDCNGKVVAGNGTLDAALALGWTEIDITRTDLKGTRAKAFAIADNRTAELAAWNDEVLAEALAEIQGDESLDSICTGFDPAEIERAIGKFGGGVTEDSIPEPPVEPITKSGDLWLLGEHRLLCGDSTKAEDVARVMAGEKADICFTSPPYALGKSVSLSGNKSMSQKGNAYLGHSDDPQQWNILMDGWFSAVRPFCLAYIVNVQPLAGNKRSLIEWISKNKDNLVDFIMWDKGHAAPQAAPHVLASRFEWLIVFANKDASRAIPFASWHGTVESVYVGPPQRENEFSSIHAATFPVHLPAWVISTLCDQSKTVIDPFLGTGTTLIAAEQLHRRCYGLEIEPRYCDVIVKRWESLTGKKATRQ